MALAFVSHIFTLLAMENPAGWNPTAKRSDDNSTANQEDKIFSNRPTRSLSHT